MWLISNLNKISDIPVPFYRNRNKDRFVILHYETRPYYDDGRIITSLRHPENQKYADRYEYKNGT
jgi:hypothetical protein